MTKHDHATACVPVPFLAFPRLDSSTELVVRTPYDNMLMYEGTRAALEAEDLIPAGTEWPQGYDDLRWRAGRFDYWLHRKRPEGAKGPRKAFAGCDWWRLHVEPTVQPSHAQIEIARKEKELNAAIYRNGSRGRAEWETQHNRYWKSTDDARFQAFKAACGIVEKQRGRPRKSKSEQGSAG